MGEKGRDHWEDLGVDGVGNIRIDLREMEWENVDWGYLTRMNTIMKFRFP
jgi:hypothetical protein